MVCGQAYAAFATFFLVSLPIEEPAAMRDVSQLFERFLSPQVVVHLLLRQIPT
jgi:hypothetical protein